MNRQKDQTGATTKKREKKNNPRTREKKKRTMRRKKLGRGGNQGVWEERKRVPISSVVPKDFE